MKIEMFGHACLKVSDVAGRAVLMDPWFTRHGAFFHAWFQFPENAPLLERALEGVEHICISHNHADHLDPETLRTAMRKRPALQLHIARFETDWFLHLVERSLPEFRSRIVEHDPFVPFDLWRGMRFWFVPEESPAQIDSAMVCSDDHTTLVDLNDARLTTRQLERIVQASSPEVILALQASGASEYPICYTYPPEDMKRRALEKRRLKFAHAEAIIDTVRPDRIVFFAGPPVFLDPELAGFNERRDDSVFPDQLDIVDHYATTRPDIAARVVFLLPGEPVDDAHLWSSTTRDDPRLRPYTKKEEYVRAYAASRKDMFPFDLGEPDPMETLLDHFRNMTRLDTTMSSHIGGSIVFNIRGRTKTTTITADFVARDAREGECDAPLYVLTAPASSVHEVLQGRVTWDDVFLSVRMVFDERTDRFVSHLKTLLKYLDRRLCRAVAEYEESLADAKKDDTMVVDVDGTPYRIQRHCPHAGADLERHGEVGSDHTITCMAHRFCFDLRTGECRTASGFRLRVD